MKSKYFIASNMPFSEMHFADLVYTKSILSFWEALITSASPIIDPFSNKDIMTVLVSFLKEFAGLTKHFLSLCC